MMELLVVSAKSNKDRSNLPIISEFIKFVSFRGQLGQVDVALGHTRTAYPSGALLTKRHRFLVLVQDVAGGVG